MNKHCAEIIVTHSIAEVILNDRDLPWWRKWLLKRLMPARLWALPPIELAKLQRGAVIGSISIDLGAQCET